MMAIASRFGGVDNMEHRVNQIEAELQSPREDEQQMETEFRRLEQMKCKFGGIEEMESKLHAFHQIASILGGIDEILPQISRLKNIEFQYINSEQMKSHLNPNAQPFDFLQASLLTHRLRFSRLGGKPTCWFFFSIFYHFWSNTGCLLCWTYTQNQDLNTMKIQLIFFLPYLWVALKQYFPAFTATICIILYNLQQQDYHGLRSVSFSNQVQGPMVDWVWSRCLHCFVVEWGWIGQLIHFRFCTYFLIVFISCRAKSNITGSKVLSGKFTTCHYC